MNTMTQYLQAVNRMASSLKSPTIEGIVLQHGKPFTPPAAPRPKGIRKGADKQCYRNAYLLAFQMDWTYVEGFAIPDCVPIPLQHAWVIDSQGNLIETTWDTPGIEYFGIPLEWDFIHKTLLDTKRYGVLDPMSKVFRQRYWV